MLNLIQHLTKPSAYETLKQVQGDKSGLFTRPSNLGLDIGDQLLDRFGISLFNRFGSPQTSLSIGRFFRQDMPCECPLGFDLSGPGFFESLCCSSVGLYFWHNLLPSKTKFPLPSVSSRNNWREGISLVR